MSGGFRFAILVACALLVGSACQTGPDGPGTVFGTVTGAPDLGGAVLDVVWKGVQGFEGQGSTQVYAAPVVGEVDRYRVILVDPAGGDLSFGILVDDLYLEAPVVTLVDATRTNNTPRSVGGLRVVLGR